MTNSGNFGSKPKVGIKAYLALIFIIIFFSGAMSELSKMSDSLSWLKAFDFITLCGSFGNLGTLEEGCGTLAGNFQGMDGTGARQAFLVAVGLIPAIMLALGTIKVAENLGALDAAGKLLTPILRPFMGVPGEAAISLVGSLQSTDAGPITSHDMFNSGVLTEKELMILTAFFYSGGGLLVNYFALGGALVAFLEIPIMIPLVVILVSKYAGSALVRFLVGRVIKLD